MKDIINIHQGSFPYHGQQEHIGCYVRQQSQQQHPFLESQTLGGKHSQVGVVVLRDKMLVTIATSEIFGFNTYQQRVSKAGVARLVSVNVWEKLVMYSCSESSRVLHSASARSINSLCVSFSLLLRAPYNLMWHITTNTNIPSHSETKERITVSESLSAFTELKSPTVAATAANCSIEVSVSDITVATPTVLPIFKTVEETSPVCSCLFRPCGTVDELQTSHTQVV